MGIEVVRTPFRAPQANGVAERFVRTARSECFDRLLILNLQHLERLFAAFIDHYNGHRPHRPLTLAPPESRRQATTVSASGDARIVRRDRLGGVVHEDDLAA
ncbi:MAG TPA: integrase core domain-containing protein [Vicinamibacterales bacterium]|nr:integrase core domain-containing protein [Vicinamibacterales bacterium]